MVETIRILLLQPVSGQYQHCASSTGQFTQKSHLLTLMSFQARMTFLLSLTTKGGILNYVLVVFFFF